jgi:hypothetical protein
MDEWLIDGDRLSLERKSVLPGEGFFRPDSVEREQAEQQVATALTGAETVVVADPGTSTSRVDRKSLPSVRQCRASPPFVSTSESSSTASPTTRSG